MCRRDESGEPYDEQGEAAATDAALQRQHDRALLADADDLNDLFVERTEAFERAAREKAGRPLRELEMRAISVRTLVELLRERGHACAQCCRAIARPEEAMAAERELRDEDGNPHRVWQLVHAPESGDAVNPNSCFGRARRRGVYLSFLMYPALPLIERAERATVVPAVTPLRGAA